MTSAGSEGGDRGGQPAWTICQRDSDYSSVERGLKKGSPQKLERSLLMSVTFGVSETRYRRYYIISRGMLRRFYTLLCSKSRLSKLDFQTTVGEKERILYILWMLLQLNYDHTQKENILYAVGRSHCLFYLSRVSGSFGVI